MKVIDRYLLREFFIILVGGLVVVTSFLVAIRLFDLMDLVLNRGIDVTVVLRLVVCLLPSIIAVALPMATLLATVMVFGRLAYDREMLAIKGAGVGLGRLVIPFAITGVLFSVALLIMNGSVLPSATAAYKRLFMTIISQRATVAFKERVFVREFDRYLLYFNRKEVETGNLMDVFVIESPPTPTRIISARRGRLAVDPGGYTVKLILEDGSLDQPEDRTGEQYSRMDFKHYEVNLDIHQALRGGKFLIKSMDEMDYGDLLAKIRALAKSPEDRRPYEIVLHMRVALAFAPFFVVFIGAPLGALGRRGGGMGILISLIVILAYYSLLTMGRGFADRDDLPVWLALWVPNVFLAIAGAVAGWGAGRELRWIRWGR